MTAQVLQALGGLGLFLLGMVVLTDGLRNLAGDAVHRVLFRFTKSPTSGALTGAGLTALLQSSSVTTVATVGFVSAGLLAFPQALGVMFGANIGTTATGWMVALFGFELDISRIVLPLVFVGLMLRLFGKHQVKSVGWALAGFAVIFLGIDAMQSSMAGFEGVVTPDQFPPDTPRGRVLLVGIGVLVTLVTQSSSAGIAAAMTALAAGALTFPQAAAMVIGMDVGTTSTTALATLGGSAQTKRTGYAHVVYNLLTGIGAFFLLDPYVRGVDAVFAGGAGGNPTLALVGFHTTFNTLGVIVILPFTRAFAWLMTRLVPDRGPDLGGRLDPALLKDPTAATLTLFGAVREMTAELFEGIALSLEQGHAAAVEEGRLLRIDHAVDTARRFAGQIAVPPQQQKAHRLHLALMHAIDHLDRLVERCRNPERIATVREDARLRELSTVVHDALVAAADGLRLDGEQLAESGLQAACDAVREERQPFRHRILATVPQREITLDEAILRLDAIRWLHRTTYHAWRIARNLEEAQKPEAPAVEPRPEREAAWEEES